MYIAVVVQLPSSVQLFATPWTAACQASLSLTISQSLLKFMFIASVMPSILWCPLLFCPQSFSGSGTFPMSHLFTSGDLNIGASASVLPVKYSGLISFRLSGLISLPSKGLAGVFSSTTVQRHQFLVFCLLYGPALTTIHDHWEDHSLDYMDLCWQSHCFSTHCLGSSLLSLSNHLLISRLLSPSAVILEPKKRKSVTTSTFPPSICHAVMGPDARILVF